MPIPRDVETNPGYCTRLPLLLNTQVLFLPLFLGALCPKSIVWVLSSRDTKSLLFQPEAQLQLGCIRRNCESILIFRFREVRRSTAIFVFVLRTCNARSVYSWRSESFSITRRLASFCLGNIVNVTDLIDCGQTRDVSSSIRPPRKNGPCCLGPLESKLFEVEHQIGRPVSYDLPSKQRVIEDALYSLEVASKCF